MKFPIYVYRVGTYLISVIAVLVDCCCWSDLDSTAVAVVAVAGSSGSGSDSGSCSCCAKANLVVSNGLACSSCISLSHTTTAVGDTMV